MPKRKNVTVLELPDHDDLTALSRHVFASPSDDTLLDMRLMIDIPKDGHSEDDIRYMRKRVRKLVNNIERQYGLLAKATDTTAMIRANINMPERTVTIFMSRVFNSTEQTEAIIKADIGLIRPMTRAELAAAGIEAPKDPYEPKKQVILQGRVYRPQSAADSTPWHELALDSYRIPKNAQAAIGLFNRMVEEGYLYHPGIKNYIPFKDSPTPLEPLGRPDRRSLEKKPVDALNADQRGFVRQQFKKFAENFVKRHGHAFEHVDMDVDTVEKTVTMRFKASKAFLGFGYPRFSIKGNFALTWKNKGMAGTALKLQITGGLSREFEQRVKMTAPIDIVGHTVEVKPDGTQSIKRNKRRAQASDMLFNLLAMSGKLNVTDTTQAKEAQKDRRKSKTDSKRRREHHGRERMRNRHIVYMAKRGIF